MGYDVLAVRRHTGCCVNSQTSTANNIHNRMKITETMVCGISFIWTGNWYRLKALQLCGTFIRSISFNFIHIIRVYRSLIFSLNEWKLCFGVKRRIEPKVLISLLTSFEIFILYKKYVNCTRKMEQNQEMLFTSWLLMWVAVWRALNVNTWKYCIQYYIFYISRLCRGKLWAFICSLGFCNVFVSTAQIR
jgi:hypothetical protein